MAVVIVPYIAINIYSHSRLVITVADNLMGLIFSRVGYGDLSMRFSN